MKKLFFILPMLACLIGCKSKPYPNSAFKYGDCVKVVDGFYEGSDGWVSQRQGYYALKVKLYAKGQWFSALVWTTEVRRQACTD